MIANVEDGASLDGVDHVSEELVRVIKVHLLAIKEIVDGYRVEFEGFGNDVDTGTMHGNSNGIDVHAGRGMDSWLVRVAPPARRRSSHRW